VPPPPISSASTWYHASGSALITRSAGFSVWPKKNQCHQARAKFASQRSSRSTIGTPSMITAPATDRG